MILYIYTFSIAKIYIMFLRLINIFQQFEEICSSKKEKPQNYGLSLVIYEIYISRFY